MQSELREETNLTYRSAALVAEDHPVPVLTRHLKRHQDQSHKDGKSSHPTTAVTTSTRYPPLPTTDLLSPAAARSRWSVVGLPGIPGIWKSQPAATANTETGPVVNLNSSLQPICNLGFWESRPHETSDGFPNSEKSREFALRSTLITGQRWWIPMHGWLICISPELIMSGGSSKA